MKKAEAVLDARDAEEAGEDIERTRNWNYSIADNEAWEAKLEQREQKRDKGDIGEYLRPRCSEGRCVGLLSGFEFAFGRCGEGL